MAVDTFPLVAPMSERGPGQALNANKDQRFINSFVEFMTPGGQGTQGAVEDPYVVKRPGVVEVRQVTAGEGRGIFEWLDDEYIVVGSTVYKNGVSIGSLSTSTGKVYFDEQQTLPKLLLINDGVSLYSVSTGGVLTTLADPDIPSPLAAGIVVLDFFAFVLTPSAQIHNSTVGDVTTWDGDFLTAELMPDDGVRINRHVNYLVVWGEDSVELFVNAGNPTGTPLGRYVGAATLHGCPAPDSVARLGNTNFYVGRNDHGHLFVSMLDERFTHRKISPIFVDEALTEMGAAISDAVGYTMGALGHDFYVLTLPAPVDKTYVFDYTTGLWYEWTAPGGGRWPYIEAEVFSGGEVRLLHESTGQVFRIDSDTYNDDGSLYTMTIQCRKHDLRVKQQKFGNSLRVMGDLAATPADSSEFLKVEFSDDDYQTFSPARDLDISKEGSRLTRMGRYTRRGYRLSHTQDTPWRAQALELDVERGSYAVS
jgi:hypothetical protein